MSEMYFSSDHNGTKLGVVAEVQHEAADKMALKSSEPNIAIDEDYRMSQEETNIMIPMAKDQQQLLSTSEVSTLQNILSMKDKHQTGSKKSQLDHLILSGGFEQAANTPEKDQLQHLLCKSQSPSRKGNSVLSFHAI